MAGCHTSLCSYSEILSTYRNIWAKMRSSPISFQKVDLARGLTDLCKIPRNRTIAGLRRWAMSPSLSEAESGPLDTEEVSEHSNEFIYFSLLIYVTMWGKVFRIKNLGRKLVWILNIMY